jgi:hypothetical protein
MPQGVVVTVDELAEQLVFDARTGMRIGLNEAGFPVLPRHFSEEP